MQLNTIKPAKGSKTVGPRVGRGPGSGLGKTCGRGHKGQKAHGQAKLGFEGGQMPIQRRLPKFGFTSRMGRNVAEIRLSELNKVEGSIINPETLQAAGLVRFDKKRIRIIASGKVTVAYTVSGGVYLTRGAAAAIQAAGGKIEA